MENKPKKSKALIIAIIVILLLLLVGYLIIKNRDAFGVKTSATIAKIFSPLIPSDNSKNLNKINVQAGEDIKKGDSVSLSNSTGSNNNPIVMKTSTTNGSVYGYANQDIKNGSIGQITLGNKNPNTFFSSFSDFLGNIFNNNTNKNQCTNGADNPTLCTTKNGSCVNNATNPPECTNINSNISCTNGADNPTLCTTKNGGCLNNATNPPDCTNIENGEPDLTVTSKVSPTENITINTPTKLSSTITNIGGSSTLHSFSNFFSFDNPGLFMPDIVTVTMPTLETGVSSTATVSYNFTLLGEYSVRVCTDKSSTSDTGTVTESNENNNCGPITIIKVGNSLPTSGDTCTNGADNPTLCTTNNGSCINGATNPPNCTNINPTTCTNGATNPPNCTNQPNICKDIEQNPLTFTDEEKARLAVLLRKFYLVSSTLKTSDDIVTTYSELDQQENFIGQIEGLTKQCYLQTNDQSGYSDFYSRNKTSNSALFDTGNNFTTNYNKNSTGLTYSAGTVKNGNPWFTKTSGGSFPYTSGDTGYTDISQLEGTTQADKCKVVSGYYYGTLQKNINAYNINATIGQSCEQFNTSVRGYGQCNSTTAITTKINPTVRQYSYNSTNTTSATQKRTFMGWFGHILGSAPEPEPVTYVLEAGCKWKEGVDLEDTERILNIW